LFGGRRCACQHKFPQAPQEANPHGSPACRGCRRRDCRSPKIGPARNRPAPARLATVHRDERDFAPGFEAAHPSFRRLVPTAATLEENARLRRCAC
jgi:hypothetical protein